MYVSVCVCVWQREGEISLIHVCPLMDLFVFLSRLFPAPPPWSVCRDMGYDLEVSESTLPTNKESWYFLGVCVCVCVAHRGGGSGGALPQLFTGYRTLFCLLSLFLWRVCWTLWLGAIVMQSQASPHIYIHYWVCLSGGETPGFCLALIWLGKTLKTPSCCYCCFRVNLWLIQGCNQWWLSLLISVFS